MYNCKSRYVQAIYNWLLEIELLKKKQKQTKTKQKQQKTKQKQKQTKTKKEKKSIKQFCSVTPVIQEYNHAIKQQV